MCRQDWCLGAVLDVTVDLVGSVVDAESATDALCNCLARRFDAAAAAYIAFDHGTETATVMAWPHPLDILRLKELLDQLPHVLPLLLAEQACDQPTPSGTDESVLAQELLGHDGLCQVPSCRPASQVRIAVLAGPRAFDQQDIHVLTCLRGTLGSLFRIAERCPAEQLRATGTGGLDNPGLTSREVEVLRLVAQGLLARTIAARLEVSPRTVHKHLGSAYRKLDAHDRLIAVRRAETLGLLTDSP